VKAIAFYLPFLTARARGDTQGDEIGRIFAHWAIVYFGQLC
jgi:hypothetical protein